jgi:5'-phosphate synthase pdxT subunit
MVKKVIIGVIGIQGAISEQLNIMKKVFLKSYTHGETLVIRQKEQLEKVDGLIIPGGESSTISKILIKTGLHSEILNRISQKNIAIMGTCAGCVLLAEEISNITKDIKPLKAMNITVKRNAFGRQKESFEKKINIDGFSKPFNAIFIRAPIIENVKKNCKILAKIENKIVMVRQNNFLAISFHPELNDDLRIHEYFLEMV